VDAPAGVFDCQGKNRVPEDPERGRSVRCRCGWQGSEWELTGSVARRILQCPSCHMAWWEYVDNDWRM
jgi:hypothetical protein